MGDWLSRLRGRAPDLLLTAAVLGFAALLVVLVGRGPGSPAPSAREPAGVRTDEVSPLAEARPPEPGTPEAAQPGPDPAGPGPSGTDAPPDPAGSGAPPFPAPAPAAAAGPGEEAGTAEVPADGELRIAGRVLDSAGNPLAGIEIEASRVDATGRDTRTTSRRDGRYVLEGLGAGNYRLTSRETASHPLRSILARAGTEGVDFVLGERRTLRIHGVVSDERGDPVAAVRVEPLGHATARVETGADGRYELRFDAAHATNLLLVRFHADGYETHEDRIRLDTELSAEGLRRDVELTPAEGRFALTGRVRVTRGEVPVGLNVYLRSNRLRANLQGATDADGDFRIEDVRAGDDWRLSVRPGSGYNDFLLGPLSLDAGSDPLEVVLEPVTAGVVTGRMVDPDGRPVPDFQLSLSSTDARIQSTRVVSDQGGHFRAEDVPSGPLRFETRAVPWLRVSGVELEAGGRLDLDLVLDVGDLGLDGRVLTEDGRPVAGADVRLSWLKIEGGIRSSSFRRTVTDAEGFFRFAQLGRGPHQLDVRASGFATTRESHDVGPRTRDLEVRLLPAE